MEGGRGTGGRVRLAAGASPGADRPRGAHGVRVLGRGEPGYPAGVTDLPDPPARLFVRGGPLSAPGEAVAIVGTRAATPYGLAIAGRLAGDLAGHGIVVVSGLARGIDARAHEGALAVAGRTVAVIPSGLDRVTPAGHERLAARIAGSGAVVSEVAKGGPFGRGAFVKRNRLIAALAAVTVVVEAGEGSGALATAAFARALGRAVLAVPADVDRAVSAGTLALLRQGARPCADAGDVLRALGSRPSAGPPAESSLLACLGAEPQSVEALARAAGASPAETLARLLRLEWSGLAVSHPGGRWASRP